MLRARDEQQVGNGKKKDKNNAKTTKFQVFQQTVGFENNPRSMQQRYEENTRAKSVSM